MCTLYMQQLPWRFIKVPSDGRCSLHCVSVASGYIEFPNNNVAHKIKSDLLEYYQGHVHVSDMIKKLFETGDFMNDQKIPEFGDSNIANPVYFKDFICEKSSWAKTVVACELDHIQEMGLCRRNTCPHLKLVSFVNKTNKHTQTTQSICKREAIVFVLYTNHWYVLMPYERSIGL